MRLTDCLKKQRRVHANSETNRATEKEGKLHEALGAFNAPNAIRVTT